MIKLEKAKAPKNIKPEWIFKCHKCEHYLYVTKSSILNVLKIDCPNCGEESFENWIFTGEGKFEN